MYAELLVAAVVLACAACSSQSSSAPDANRELDCVREGYPCTLGEVPAAVMERSDELANEAYERITGGESVAEVAESLRAQEDVVAIRNDLEALWFRVAGGRPHWVISDAAFPEVPEGSPTALAPIEVRGDVPAPDAESYSTKDVVGPFPKEKRALVLSPYLYEFAANDDGPVVAALLQEARGYRDNVVFKANEVLGAMTITGGDFKNWDAFDVVHVSSHGTQLCDSSNEDCDLVLLQGRGAVFEEELVLSTTGYSLVVSRLPGTRYGVSDDYFRNAYPNGLSETIVSFSACKTAKGPEFGAILANPSSVFFGWNKTVLSSFALATTEALFQRLIDTGRTTENVFQTLDAGDPTANPIGATLLRFQGGDDLRIRELITAYESGATPGPDTVLEDGDAITIDGVPNDGMPDKMPFIVDIDGVEDDDDLSKFVLHISVDGTEATSTWTLAEGVQVDEHTYRLEGEAAFGVDFDTSTEFDVQYWVELPEGGESRLPLELSVARWQMRYSGPFLSGTYRGSVAELGLRNAFGSGNILILESGEIDIEPIVRINTTWLLPIMSGDNVFELRAPPIPPDPDEIEGTAISVITFRDVVDDGMGNLADTGVVNGDGVSTVIQPDDTVYVLPPPPTLTLFAYDANASTVRGSIEGQYGVCYGFVDVGAQGFCDTYNVSIDFLATQEVAEAPGN